MLTQHIKKITYLYMHYKYNFDSVDEDFIEFIDDVLVIEKLSLQEKNIKIEEVNNEFHKIRKENVELFFYINQLKLSILYKKQAYSHDKKKSIERKIKKHLQVSEECNLFDWLKDNKLNIQQIRDLLLNINFDD